MSAQSAVPPPPTAPAGVPTAADARNDGKAVASLILGICSLTILSIVAGIPAVILGHMSRSDIRKSMGRLKGEGLALAGLIMGYLSLLAIPVVLIIAAIAIPNLLRSRVAANEASAIGSIRTINTAQITYASTFDKGFSVDLDSLGGSGCSETTDASHACLIDTMLASGHKSGYRYSYQAFDDDGDGVMERYFIVAYPLTPGSSGRSSFCSDESGVIRRESSGQECTASSPVLD
jgi:type IV pilus assembly protein PilA